MIRQEDAEGSAKVNAPAAATKRAAYNSAPPIRHIHVVANPASGQDEPVLKPLNRLFAEMDIEWDISVTKGEGDARRDAHAAAERGVDAVAVYGGDGTVLEVASGLVGTETPLLILPGGTANVISIELGVPRKLEEAVALAADGASWLRAIDMGQVGDQYFFHLGMGLEGEMIRAATREAKDRSGLLAYIFSALRHLRSLPVVKYRLVLDGEVVEVKGINLMITNFGSLGLAGLSLSKKIDMSDGLMDVLVIRNIDLKTFVEAAAGVLASGEVGSQLTQWQAREVEVIADPPQTMTRDGEVCTIEDVRARVVPHAVRVLVPRPSEK